MERIKERTFLEKIKGKENVQDFFDWLLYDYEKRKDQGIPVLSMELWDIFNQTGSRAEYEKPYFEKRNFTVVLALLALFFPERENFLALLKEYIRSTCDEYSWAVPAHCKETGDDRTCVDLFASETACMLAEIVFLLEKDLGVELVNVIKAEITKRVFIPYSQNNYWWETGWNNWTSVCCGNIAIAMMRIAPNCFEREKERILRSMSLYINSFPDDGNCLEGLGYWHYGFGSWVWFADALYSYSNGAINLFQNDKVKNIATYAQKMFLKGNVAVSIADSGINAKGDTTLLAYLHERYPKNCLVPPKELSTYWDGNVSWIPKTRRILYGFDAKHELTLPQKNHFFKNAGQAIVNMDTYSLFVKAGHNDESHNHNDVGSFILSTDKGQIFCDLGAGKYFDGYFAPEIRYTLLNTASWGHSVPIIDGKYQKAGAKFCGMISWKDNEIVVDFSKAYGDTEGKLVRKFRYENSRIIMVDCWQGYKEVTERFITLKKPQIVADGVIVENVKLTADKLVPVIKQYSYDGHGYSENKIDAYTIDYVITKKETVLFTMEIL